jgi:DNA-binding transcriptional MerR regulator
MRGFRVVDAARQAGMTPSAVRYYERRGLLPPPARTPAGYRLLGREAVERLRFIRQAQALGLRLEEIRVILRLRDHGEAPCQRVQQLATRRLRAIDEKIAELRRLRSALLRLIARARRRTTEEGHICSLIEGLSQREARTGSVPRKDPLAVRRVRRSGGSS